MAARENQGYLIAVIILVLMVLLLALGTFLGFQSSSSQTDLRESAEAQKKLYDNLAQANEIEANIYRAYIGEVGGPAVAEVNTLKDKINTLANNSGDDNIRAQLQKVVDRIEGVQGVYDNDMLQNIASNDAEETAQEFTYKGLVKNLSRVVAAKHGELAVQRNTNRRTKNEAESEIQAKQKVVDTL